MRFPEWDPFALQVVQSDLDLDVSQSPWRYLGWQIACCHKGLFELPPQRWPSWPSMPCPVSSPLPIDNPLSGTLRLSSRPWSTPDSHRVKLPTPWTKHTVRSPAPAKSLRHSPTWCQIWFGDFESPSGPGPPTDAHFLQQDTWPAGVKKRMMLVVSAQLFAGVAYRVLPACLPGCLADGSALRR